MKNGMSIGITIGLRSPNESLWVNGIKQNALYLAKLLMHSPRGYRVTLVNTTDVPLTDALPWDRQVFKTRTWHDVKDDLDLLIELGGQIDPEQTDYLKARGTKLVSYCCGVEYISVIESILFGRRLWDTLFINPHFDEVWAIPQVATSSLSYLQTIRHCPGRVVPFVWDPIFITERARAFGEQSTYRPSGVPAKRITVMEPNFDVVKCCVYPILMINEVYRSQAQRIAYLHVTSAEHLARNSPEFVMLMNHLEIVRAGHASFIGRYETPEVLAKLTDVVVSHQWENPLNYMYFDVCWLGYPLVHNANLIPDIGYYYPGNDVQQGAARLSQVLVEHDMDWENYTAQQQRLLRRFTADNTSLIEDYDRLIEHVLGRPHR
ncbi:DUF2827 domain-containing protein [Burkholderia ubonensis]|uniref:DUF2827 domain-containing protein n=1 Tax=Burkholderia ubonensis TaxID=101571 RepID=UPI00075D469F|nr:DUF2827 domain-containing protein [Burkholderia ubonensis]KVW83263.1 hypothetical protein WK99_19190 [Burkholderia ubonensis]